MVQLVSIGITSDEVTPIEWFTWIKGYIMNHGDKTPSQYTIKKTDGCNYMFYEWKSGI